MSYEEFQELYQRCTSGNCTREEQILFEEYRDSFDLSDVPWLPEFGNKTEIEKLLKKDLNKRLLGNNVLHINFAKWSVAAAILVFALSAIFFANKYIREKEITPYTNARDKNIIKPGSEKAILTLADGSQLTLDKSRKGILFTLPIVYAENTTGGSIAYHETASGTFHSSQIYNVISTPRGGKYQLILADGTKVWLNAASSIRYPVNFTGVNREVELSGEAYFEVAHDANRPFKVRSAGQVVQVLGTHFNINAYKDEEAVKTTLLEGRVQVYQMNRPAVATALSPNEQSVFENDQLSKVSVDADEFTTWTNGLIVFRDADIHTVMRKISRWYDVDVIYDGQMSGDTYNGEIPKNAAFSEVLKILKMDDIHIKVSGRSLIVSQ